jgi:two-component system nitrogen regulation response regulator NtrX
MAGGECRCSAQDACRKRPDLVLLDIWMPDTDGISLLKEWSAGGLLTMPVVMMSGHGTIDTAVEATRIGAADFLEKPIALQKLLLDRQEGAQA